MKRFYSISLRSSIFFARKLKYVDIFHHMWIFTFDQLSLRTITLLLKRAANLKNIKRFLNPKRFFSNYQLSHRIAATEEQLNHPRRRIEPINEIHSIRGAHGRSFERLVKRQEG